MNIAKMLGMAALMMNKSTEKRPVRHEEVFWRGVTQPSGQWYEHCSFDPVPTPTGLPDYVFRVTMWDVANKKALTDFKVLLQADAQTWAFILAHPTWRKEPRPFMLDCLQQVLWMIKIVSLSYGKPATLNTGVASIQGGKIRMTVTAEVLYDSGGDTVLHVVNYANTHVMDQIRAVYDQNPTAMPTVARIEKVKAEFFREQDKKRAALQREQEENLKTRSAAGPDLVVFADESGDIGFRSLSNVYTISATILNAACEDAFRSELRAIIDANWPNTKPSELHFNSVPPGKLPQVRMAIADCFLKNGARCITFAAPKTGFLHYLLRCEAEQRRSEENPIVTHWPDVLSKSASSAGGLLLCLLLEEILTHLGADALATGSRLSVCHDRKYRQWMNDVLAVGFARSQESIKTVSESYYGKAMVPAMTFRLADSPAEPCLWASDWVSWEMSRWFRGIDLSPDFERCIPGITFISFDETGRKATCSRPGTVADRYLPDWPRDIVATIAALGSNTTSNTETNTN